MRIIFAAAIIAVAMTACNKAGEVDCIYVVTPYLQDEDKGPVEVACDALGYVFYADTAAWLPSDYDQAAAGVISSRAGSGTMNFDIQGTLGEDGKLTFAPVTETPVMVVVCFPGTRSWAVRQAPMEGGIAQISVSVTFRAWQGVSPFMDSRWWVWNQEPPVTVDCDIEVPFSIQEEKDGAAIPVDSVVGYAFWADTVNWTVASLADALSGKLTNATTSSQTRDFDLQAGEGLFFEGITRRRALLVAADSVSRTYAVKQVRIQYDDIMLSEPLTIPWDTLWPRRNDGWIINYEPVPDPDKEGDSGGQGDPEDSD